MDHINDMPEKNRFIRGLRSWVGYKQFGFEYHRNKRAAGNPKYTFKMLFQLAYNGIFNFSTIPIKFVYKIGFISLIFSVIYIFYTLINKFYFKCSQGYTSLIIIITLFASVQLISIGIIGEYIIRIHKQSQNRPLYIVEKVIRKKEINNG